MTCAVKRTSSRSVFHSKGLIESIVSNAVDKLNTIGNEALAGVLSFPVSMFS